MDSYRSSQIEIALHKLSESAYAALCLKLGTSKQVAIRRETMDIAELIRQKVRSHWIMMDSGSRREGFRLWSSDINIMYWVNNQRVMWDFSQAQLYDTHRYTLILCDSAESPPGFTLLWLPLDKASIDVLSSCVRINGALYISSTMYRQNTCTLISSDSTLQGPCSSGKSDGGLEYDYAHCFKSDCWPPSASSWKNRCHSWSPPHVVDEITRSGCHFVAIGHKLGKHADNEWRISFSQAEQKLVYAMNHTQFLTFGLLKLFVNEINKGLHEEEKLLCSYHMKTLIFWVIQQNTIPDWSPRNLLESFWISFKLLLKWVYEGVCPNFFISENNMFLHKVHGVAQSNLFTRLYALYEKGITFMLHSTSISPHVMLVICNPRLSVCTDERALISETEFDLEIVREVSKDLLIAREIHICIRYLNMVEQLVWSPLTQYQTIMLQKITSTVFQRSAFTFHDLYLNTTGVNKEMYIADKISCNMLKLAAKFGYVSDLLYIAMYFYKIFRYKEALSVTDITKVKLTQPGLMYGAYVDPERYIEAVGGQSWSYKMRQAVALNIEARQ